MSRKFIAPYDVSMMLSNKALEVDQRLRDIMMESHDKTLENIRREANKLAYELAEKQGVSLWDICLRSIPHHSWDIEAVDGIPKMIAKIEIVPIEFDFEHSPDYWEKKYKELKRQLIELTLDKPEKDDEGTAIGDNH